MIILDHFLPRLLVTHHVSRKKDIVVLLQKPVSSSQQKICLSLFRLCHTAIMAEHEPPPAQPDSPVVPIDTMSDLEPPPKAKKNKNGNGEKKDNKDKKDTKKPAAQGDKKDKDKPAGSGDTKDKTDTGKPAGKVKAKAAGKAKAKSAPKTKAKTSTPRRKQ